MLFVCVHNAGRSQMAAALLDHHAQGRVNVRSAGSDPADQVNPEVIEALAEWDIDVTQEFPKPLTDEVARAADVIVTMGCGDACPVYPGKRYLDWQLEDPAGQPLEKVRVIRNGLRVKALNGPIPPPLKWAVDESQKFYEYDLNKAKQKLTEGGQPNGFSFTLLTDTSSPISQKIAELWQSQLKKVGIDMKIDSGDFNNVVVKRGLAGDFEAAGIVISGGIDPDSWIYSTFHTGANFNIPHLSDPQVDKLAEQGRQESDLNKRADYYKQATKIVMDYSPWVMFDYSLDRFTGNKKVQGWYLGLKATAGYSEYWKTSD